MPAPKRNSATIEDFIPSFENQLDPIDLIDPEPFRLDWALVPLAVTGGQVRFLNEP